MPFPEGEREEWREEQTTHSMFRFSSGQLSPYRLNTNMNGKAVDMEVHTGASLSVMSEKS